VHPATYEVLHAAQSIAEASGGIFDITTAGPHHSIGRRPGADAHWTDVQLADDYTVRFRKPLLIDVSGIAKGYAVDRAVAVLQHHGASRGAVNAGGDLRIFGPESERVALRPPRCPNDSLPVIEIENAAIASSSGQVQPGCHIDPRDGQPLSPDRFAAVIAESCMIADALTKPALILRERSENLLSRYGACAHLHAPGAGWMHLGAAP
jgi:thiamine biosynthesis lipoprotein